MASPEVKFYKLKAGNTEAAPWEENLWFNLRMRMKYYFPSKTRSSLYAVINFKTNLLALQ